MKKQRYWTLVPLFLMLTLVLVISVFSGTNQRRDGDFSTMIHSLLEGDELVMFVLNTPLSTGEFIITTDEAIVQVGDDYLCFGETWNDGLRQRCTPFSNVAGVTFIEKAPSSQSPSP